MSTNKVNINKGSTGKGSTGKVCADIVSMAANPPRENQAVQSLFTIPVIEGYGRVRTHFLHQ